MQFYDFLFKFTEESENAGEQILCEETNLNAAWNTLLFMYGFKPEELQFIERLSLTEGEMLGLDVY